MAGRPLCWTAHLVLMLVAAARCSASQQPQQPQQQQYSGDPLEQLLALVSRAVTAAADPIVAELGSQRTLLDGIVSRLEVQDARLDSQRTLLDGIVSRLEVQDARLEALNAGQATLSGRLARQDANLDTMKFGLDTLNDRLSTLTAGQNALKAGQHALHARVNSSVAAMQVLPRDCSDLPTGTGTGVYTLRPGGGCGDPTDAYCDMETDGGGWTVFQRRADLLPRQNFFLDWADYRAGFGNMTGEFWWGLQKLHLMTSALDRRYELRIDLEDFDGNKRYAVYQGFVISSETDGYRLAGGNYSGDAGDSLAAHFGKQFSTKDRDQDPNTGHCAQALKGAWWYRNCYQSHLNGEYLSGNISGDTSHGVAWNAWRGDRYSLKWVEMKVRPATNV